MKIESNRFGVVEVPEDRVLQLVRPVIGFPELDRFAVIEDPGSAPVLWLQAVGERQVLFPVIDAAWVPASTGVDLTDEEAAALGLERAEDARLLFILTLDPNPRDITINLRAPIVWNTRRAMGMQVVLPDPELPVSYPIGAVAGERRSNKEVACARPDAPQR
jgi:flagellar assembly factor FliW